MLSTEREYSTMYPVRNSSAVSRAALAPPPGLLRAATSEVAPCLAAPRDDRSRGAPPLPAAAGCRGGPGPACRPAPDRPAPHPRLSESFAPRLYPWLRKRIDFTGFGRLAAPLARRSGDRGRP